MLAHGRTVFIPVCRPGERAFDALHHPENCDRRFLGIEFVIENGVFAPGIFPGAGSDRPIPIDRGLNRHLDLVGGVVKARDRVDLALNGIEPFLLAEGDENLEVGVGKFVGKDLSADQFVFVFREFHRFVRIFGK